MRGLLHEGIMAFCYGTALMNIADNSCRLTRCCLRRHVIVGLIVSAPRERHPESGRIWNFNLLRRGKLSFAFFLFARDYETVRSYEIFQMRLFFEVLGGRESRKKKKWGTYPRNWRNNRPPSLARKFRAHNRTWRDKKFISIDLIFRLKYCYKGKRERERGSRDFPTLTYLQSFRALRVSVRSCASEI